MPFKVIVGEVIRKTAIIQLGSNFTLKVRIKRNVQQKLITDGIYGLVITYIVLIMIYLRKMRHPSYLGWYLWAMGMMLLIGNVGCFLICMISVNIFFRVRVRMEDYYLYEFFGDDYLMYRVKTRSGIPFVR